MNDQLKELGEPGELASRHGKGRTLMPAGPELRVQRICDRILERLNEIPTGQIRVSEGLEEVE